MNEKGPQITKNIVDEISGGAIVKMRDRLLQMQRDGKKIYRLESGDPSFSTPDHVVLAILEALKSGKTHYTESAGIPELREAIASKLKTKNRISTADPGHVTVTNGGMNALYVVFRALLGSEDKVIVPDPMWTEIPEIVKLSGGVPVLVSIENYSEALKKLVNDKKLKAIFINSPHNPTGKVFSKSEILDIIDTANDNDLWILSDEAYEDVIFDDREHFSPGSAYPYTVSLFSMSKTYAMSGLRIGYVHTNDDLLVGRIKKLLRCTINGVNSISQAGAVAALTGPQNIVKAMNAEYQKRRDILYSGVKDCRYLEPKKPDGAFYLWCKIKEYPPGVNNSQKISEFILEQTGVGSSPGSVFGPSGERYVRFAFSAKTETIEEAAELLRKMG